MAETTPGGRYLRADGKTWVDANDELAEAPTRRERREHDAAQDAAERQSQEAAAQQAAITETPAVRRPRG